MVLRAKKRNKNKAKERKKAFTYLLNDKNDIILKSLWTFKICIYFVGLGRLHSVYVRLIWTKAKRKKAKNIAKMIYLPNIWKISYIAYMEPKKNL